MKALWLSTRIISCPMCLLPIGSFNGDGDITSTRENQMEKKLDNDMENWDCKVVGSPP